MIPRAPTEELRIVENARRLSIPAFTTAVALELCAPVVGRTWVACCCWCLDRHDPQGDAPAHRLARVPEADFPGFCQLCPVNGADVLVAALPRAEAV